MNDTDIDARLNTLERAVTRIEAKLDYLYQELKLEYKEDPVALEAAYMTQVRGLVQQNRPMEAIRMYREQAGVGLAEAKAVIDGLQRR